MKKSLRYRPTLQDQFFQIYGEYGFSYFMIQEILQHIGSYAFRDAEAIRRFCLEQELAVPLRELGISTPRAQTRFLVPQSHLQDILIGLCIPTTQDDLQQAAQDLGYRWYFPSP